MYDSKMLGAHDALREARECCERIASALYDTSFEAEQIGDRELLKRINAASASASRAAALIEKLAVLMESEQSNKIQ